MRPVKLARVLFVEHLLKANSCFQQLDLFDLVLTNQHSSHDTIMFLMIVYFIE